MTRMYDAFEISPVPAPTPDAVAPELYHGIYGMPAFVTIPTTDLAASTDFWVRGLGFFELFTIPGTLVHLRRWAFQDVLLAAADTVPDAAPASSFSVAAVLGQLPGIADACRALASESVTGPYDTAWNTRDLEVITPERARIVVTAAKPYDPDSSEARALADIGIGTDSVTPSATRETDDDRP